MSTPNAYPRLKEWFEANVGHLSAFPQLSKRELELAQLFWDNPNTTAKKAAAAFGVSPRTIQNQIASIYNKTGTGKMFAALKVLLEAHVIDLGFKIHEHTLIHICRDCGATFKGE